MVGISDTLNSNNNYEKFKYLGQVLLLKNGTKKTLGNSSTLSNHDLEKLRRMNQQSEFIQAKLPDFIKKLQVDIQQIADHCVSNAHNWSDFIDKIYRDLCCNLSSGKMLPVNGIEVEMTGGFSGVLLTALRFSLGILQVIPEALGNNSSTTKMINILHSGKKLSNEFAKLHLAIIKDLQFDLQDKVKRTGLMMRGIPEENLTDHPSLKFNPNYFSIKNSRITLSDEAITKFSERYKDPNVTSKLSIGCPAKFVMFEDPSGANKTNGVNGIDYIYMTIQNALLPYLDRFITTGSH